MKMLALVVLGLSMSALAEPKAKPAIVCKAVDSTGAVLAEASVTSEAACTKALEAKMLATCTDASANIVIIYGVEKGSGTNLKMEQGKVHCPAKK